MQLYRESNNAKNQITNYTASSITINTTEYKHSVVVMPDHVMPWAIHEINALKTEDLLALSALKPEIILLGTGSELVFPPPSVTQVLFPQHIGLEIMTTPAACRTYAALTSEGRNVLAALVLGQP